MLEVTNYLYHIYDKDIIYIYTSHQKLPLKMKSRSVIVVRAIFSGSCVCGDNIS